MLASASDTQYGERDTRPRVMLIPNLMNWILGTWAKEILKWNQHRYDIVIFPFDEVFDNEALFAKLLNEVDIVHCLSQSIYPKLNKIIHKFKVDHLTLISSVHHIVHLSQVEECLSADKIMVVCRQFQEELISSGVPEDKIFLVYNGVDAELYKPLGKQVSRREFGIPPDGFTIGFSANRTSDHDGRKGVDILQSVLSNFSLFGENTHVIMTGPGWEDVISSFPIARERIHYFPYLPTERMPVYYNALDVYLVTARVEGGPVPPLEAMSCGTAVVSTPVGTVLDFFQDGVNALIVPINDVAATVSALIRLQADRQLLDKLGTAGRETIIKNLQWKDTVSRIDQLYGFDVNPERWKFRKPEYRDFTKLNVQLIRNDEKRWQNKHQLENNFLKRMSILLQKIRG